MHYEARVQAVIKFYAKTKLEALNKAGARTTYLPKEDMLTVKYITACYSFLLAALKFFFIYMTYFIILGGSEVVRRKGRLLGDDGGQVVQ